MCAHVCARVWACGHVHVRVCVCVCRWNIADPRPLPERVLPANDLGSRLLVLCLSFLQSLTQCRHTMSKETVRNTPGAHDFSFLG